MEEFDFLESQLASITSKLNTVQTGVIEFAPPPGSTQEAQIWREKAIKSEERAKKAEDEANSNRSKLARLAQAIKEERRIKQLSFSRLEEKFHEEEERSLELENKLLQLIELVKAERNKHKEEVQKYLQGGKASETTVSKAEVDEAKGKADEATARANEAEQLAISLNDQLVAVEQERYNLQFQIEEYNSKLKQSIAIIKRLKTERETLASRSNTFSNKMTELQSNLAIMEQESFRLREENEKLQQEKKIGFAKELSKYPKDSPEANLVKAEFRAQQAEQFSSQLQVKTQRLIDAIKKEREKQVKEGKDLQKEMDKVKQEYTSMVQRAKKAEFRLEELGREAGSSLVENIPEIDVLEENENIPIEERLRRTEERARKAEAEVRRLDSELRTYKTEIGLTPHVGEDAPLTLSGGPAPLPPPPPPVVKGSAPLKIIRTGQENLISNKKRDPLMEMQDNVIKQIRQGVTLQRSDGPMSQEEKLRLMAASNQESLSLGAIVSKLRETRKDNLDPANKAKQLSTSSFIPSPAMLRPTIKSKKQPQAVSITEVQIGPNILKPVMKKQVTLKDEPKAASPLFLSALKPTIKKPALPRSNSVDAIDKSAPTNPNNYTNSGTAQSHDDFTSTTTDFSTPSYRDDLSNKQGYEQNVSEERASDTLPNGMQNTFNTIEEISWRSTIRLDNILAELDTESQALEDLLTNF